MKAKPMSDAADDLPQDEVKRNSKNIEKSTEREKDSIENTPSPKRTESSTQDEEIISKQPTVRQSYVQLQNSGKVAALVKILEGRSSQPYRTEKEDELDSTTRLQKCKETQSFSKGATMDFQTWEPVKLAKSNIPTDSSNPDAYFYSQLPFTKKPNQYSCWKTHCELSTESSLTEKDESRLKKPKARTAPSFELSLQKSTCSKTAKNTKPWPPVRLGSTPTGPIRAAFKPTPFVEISQMVYDQPPSGNFATDSNFDSQRDKPTDHSLNTQHHEMSGAQTEWMNMKEQHQFTLVDRIRQQNEAFNREETLDVRRVGLTDKEVMQKPTNEHQTVPTTNIQARLSGEFRDENVLQLGFKTAQV
ncbi:unnamed protein product [Echinostoma caproni]|uniref:RAD51 associated protein 2 n=1 Tax=Echinostoma caproni TaxID=27848 RepID=A0A183AXK8_9TREM|nr:unnamed protein product [Echinostoma caproni]